MRPSILRRAPKQTHPTSPHPHNAINHPPFSLFAARFRTWIPVGDSQFAEGAYCVQSDQSLRERGWPPLASIRQWQTCSVLPLRLIILWTIGSVWVSILLVLRAVTEESEHSCLCTLGLYFGRRAHSLAVTPLALCLLCLCLKILMKWTKC
jgi:hypothetical protein